MIQIKKRDGNLEVFNCEKIERAIEKAIIDVYGVNDLTWPKTIAEGICQGLTEGDTTTVEDIQDLVELQLMKHDPKVAKAYIIYRNKRTELRNNPQWKLSELGKSIYENKYRLNNENFKDFLNRVAGGNQNIVKLMTTQSLLPAGRILAGRGTHVSETKVTLSNCYVLPPPEDNLESIFDTAKEMARTYSWGGGVGIVLSKLRPNKAKVFNAAKTTSGPVSFIDLYDTTTSIIGQHNRRGALMIAMDCTHPDILDFINSKTDLAKATKANISVMISEDFMEAVLEDKDWEVYFDITDTGERVSHIVKASTLFHTLCKNNWDFAEPGILFWDRIKKWNLLSEDDLFELVGINPCGEEPLPAYGSCNLLSHNLASFVNFMFTHYASFDFEKFDYAVRQSVIYMNEILDESIANKMYPLEQQLETVIKWRQIGIGIMGLADMFIKMGITYGSKESLELSDKIGYTMINAALQQSALLAKQYGAYPEYRAEAVLASPFLKYNATPETIKLIQQYGLRNSQLLTIAPTGSISTMWGISGGIEPLFQISYTRKTETLHEEDTYYKIFTDIAKEYMDTFSIKKEEDLPKYFVTSSTLSFYDRIDMQAVWQSHIDASISSTINLPFITSVSQIKDLYTYAYEKGLKGCTVFRDGCKRTGILTVEGNKEIEITNDTCPECGERALVKSGGCTLCTNCGHSPCM